MSQEVLILVLGRGVKLSVPADCLSHVRHFFRLAISESGEERADLTIHLAHRDDGGWSVSAVGVQVIACDGIGSALWAIVNIASQLAAVSQPGVVRESAIGNEIGTALVIERNGAVATGVLTAWLIERGFRYASQNVSLVDEGCKIVGGFAGPLVVASDLTRKVALLPGFRELPSVSAGSHVLIEPGAAWRMHALSVPVRLAILSEHKRNARLRISTADSESVAEALGDLAPGLVVDQQRALQIAEGVPAVRIVYDELSELEGVVDRFVRNAIEVPFTHEGITRQFSAFSHNSIVPDAFPVPPRTERRVDARLTIGMACYDDFDGAYFSIQALRMYHAEAMDDVEIVLLDNHPDGPCAQALKDLEKHIPNYRYVPVDDVTGTAVRDRLFAEAAGEFILCMDCHVFLWPGALAALRRYFDENADGLDLIQGPLVSDSLDYLGSHWKPEWRRGMFGTWEMSDAAADPSLPAFEIGMQGLGVFACRRDAWPGFNPKFRGFGGEEGYIQEKFRQSGRKVLCLPSLRWMHRFVRPMGVPYRINWPDRVRNYIIGHRELALDTKPLVAHFSEFLGERRAADIFASVDKELASPFSWFDNIVYINLDREERRKRRLEMQLRYFGIDKMTSRFAAVETPENHHIGCALSHRALIAEAARKKLGNILVLEDDVIFHRDTLRLLPAIFDELSRVDWDILYLGGITRGRPTTAVPSCRTIRASSSVTTTHAIVYNSTIFERILGDIPASAEGMRDWVSKHEAIDQYLNKLPAKKLLADPMIAVQPFFLTYNEVPAEDFLRLG